MIASLPLLIASLLVPNAGHAARDPAISDPAIILVQAPPTEEQKKRQQQQPPARPNVQPAPAPQPPRAQPAPPPQPPRQNVQPAPPPQPPRQNVQPAPPPPPPPPRQNVQPVQPTQPPRQNVQQPPQQQQLPGQRPPIPPAGQAQPQPQQQQQQLPGQHPPTPPAGQAQPQQQQQQLPGQRPPSPPAGQAQPQPSPLAPGQRPPGGAGPAVLGVQPQPIAPARPGGAPVVNDQRRFEEFRAQRRERVEDGGRRTVIEEPGRLIVRDGDRTFIRHDETERFRMIDRDARFDRRPSGETFMYMRRPGNAEIITVLDADGRLLRRVRRFPDGREIVIIDNSRYDPRVGFYLDVPPPRLVLPPRQYVVETDWAGPSDIYAALSAAPIEAVERPYSLDEIRFNYNLRARLRSVDIDTITFEFGSWEVTPDQAPRLEPIAAAIQNVIQQNPNEVFLIEGHTDAVGSDVDNLSLSDRRAEAVAVILTQNFQIPPENLTTQGYGKQFLKVPTQDAERRNRRVTIRRITALLAGRS